MLTEENQFYTYVYLDPRKPGDFIYQRGIDEVYNFNFELIYTGKGCDNRIDVHIKKALKTNENKLFYNVIRKIYKADLEPIRIKILQNVSGEEAFAEEINLISIAGRRDQGKGPLCNKTDGGEGVVGVIKENLSGKTFTKLIVLNFHSKDKCGKSKWLCKCDCGNEKIIVSSSLKDGKTKSCGCLQKISASTHEMKKHPLYDVWRGMFDTCRRNDNIIICKRWYNIENFIHDMGDKPTKKHLLGRLNLIGNFEPNNCNWVTIKQHANNKNSSRKLTISSLTKTISEWSEISGTKYTTIFARINDYGWTPEEAVFGK